jgi:hypothetical protein
MTVSVDDLSITTQKIADNAIDSDHYIDGSIDKVHIADNAIDSDHYIDGSIDKVHIAADAVDGTKIADNAVGNEHLEDDAVGVAELSATGTASNTTFLRGDNTWATENTGGPSLGTDHIIRTNDLTISEDITFVGDENGITYGPITVAATYTVTVTSPSVWHVL